MFLRNEWEKASEFPEALTSVACCSLVLPNATVAMLTREKEKTKSIDQFDLLMDTDSVEDVIS